MNIPQEDILVPQKEVARDLVQVGCPILDQNVIVTIYHPQKWF